jgi:septal ring factor EnvC (AmiA/AmiB activator)
MAEPAEWLIQLTQTLADLSLTLAQANLTQGVQTQAKLDQLIAQGVAIMAELEDQQAALDAQGAAITQEFAEIGAKVDALEATIAAGGDATQELADLKAGIAASTQRIQEYTAAIGELSTAGDDVPPQP